MSGTKQIRIEQTGNGLFFAKYNGGGQLPATLSGVWTREKELQGRINAYLSKRKPSTPTQRKEAVTKKATTRKPSTQKKEE